MTKKDQTDMTKKEQTDMTKNGVRRHQLRDLLRTRRARISPAEVGLTPGSRRRAHGLLREEVAKMADVSVTWYTWFEQGRDIRVSGRFLDRLSRVLKLDPTERALLIDLASQRPVVDSASSKEQVGPVFHDMFENTETFTALVWNRHWDAIAWNRAVCAAFLDFDKLPPSDRNGLWSMFMNQKLRKILINWETVARDWLASFRIDYDRHAGDPDLVELVERLNHNSPEFAQWWPQHDVHPRAASRVHTNHPLVGHLVWESANFSFKENPELTLSICTPAPELDSIRKFRRVMKSFRKSAVRPAKFRSGGAANGR
jgi:transcriptional regulator with XRE-family HTH domain